MNADIYAEEAAANRAHRVSGYDVVSEPELAARIALLDAVTMRWVLFRLASGADDIRADLAACLDAADRKAAT